MKQHYFTPAFLLALGSVLLGCNEGKSNLEDSIDPNRGIVLENMDTTINPGDNFFLFVNGGWYSRTEIPAEEGRWGSFNELQEANNTVLLQVLTDASNNTDKYPAGSDERSEEHTSELQSRENLVCRLLLEKKKYTKSIRQV